MGPILIWNRPIRINAIFRVMDRRRALTGCAGVVAPDMVQISPGPGLSDQKRCYTQ